MLGREGENKCLLLQIVIERKVLVLRDSSEGLWCANAALEMVKTVPVLGVLVARPANRHISWRIWREGSHHGSSWGTDPAQPSSSSVHSTDSY